MVKTDLRVMLAGLKGKEVGSWTQGEKRGRVSGVLSASLPLLAHEALIHDDGYEPLPLGPVTKTFCPGRSSKSRSLRRSRPSGALMVTLRKQMASEPIGLIFMREAAASSCSARRPQQCWPKHGATLQAPTKKTYVYTI
eukprot:1194566-Prorocentrum_minimum.AAC.3